ncbi:MAG: DNA-3-methyladenine glycosylase 2 family protein, partial [Candidatus Latescibacterota bacterium]
MALCYDPNKAIQTLSKADKKLGQLIKTVGRLDIDPPARLNPFEALLRSIVYQQLSGKAAATIHGRVKSLFTGRTIKPIDVINTPEEMLRGAGMSRAKVAA